jgi:dipeptidyl aminopeptidase/acylaminoacyl peptidase
MRHRHRTAPLGAVPHLFLAVLLLLPAATPPGLHAQATPFTTEDFFQLRSPSLEALSPDGRWAVISHTSAEGRLGIDNYRFGDPTYVAPVLSRVEIVDTRTGEARLLFPEERQLQQAAWSPGGDRLALVLRRGGREEALNEAPFDLVLWERESDRFRTVRLPEGRVLAPAAGDTELRWLPDGSAVVFPMYTATWAEEAGARFHKEVHGPIVVRSSANDFLSWEEVRRMGLTRSLGLARVPEGVAEELLPELALGGWDLTGDGEWIRVQEDITEGTDYDRIFGRDHRVLLRSTADGEEREVLEHDGGITLRWSGDGRAWTYRKGDQLLFGSLALEEPRRLAGPADTTGALDEGDGDEGNRGEGSGGHDGGDEDEPRFSPLRLNHDGSLLVASTDDGLWLIRTDSGERHLFLEEDPENDESPRWSVVAWEREGDRFYLTYGSRTEWEWGVYRYDPARGQMEELVKDGRRWSGLTLSEDGSTLLVQVAEAGRPAEIFAADADMGGVRALTDANPWLEQRRLGEVELLRYLDVDGEVLHGILHYPPDHEEGLSHPTVFILYETFFDPTFNTTAALLNAHGYLVVQPSVNLVEGQPGEAWLKGVTAAANQLIDRGIADPKRLGVQGVSYGGYAVNLLVAQTPRFAAAINISGKTNMVSFYTDSPRLATRNTHAPERSQDRIGATLWEQPHRYLAHSAVMVADRIHTPLLLLTGQQDHNVTERTTSEMYYALRRLDREVEWVSYIDGGHGMPRSTRAEAEDYLARIVDWYARHMGDPEAAADGEDGR